MVECKLHPSERQTTFGGLCVLERHLSEEGILEPLSGVKIAQKTVRHSPREKLTDALVGILVGCKTLSETNVRVCPDLPLQRAFDRERVADQSTIQRTLDAFTQENIHQLREAVETFGKDRFRLLRHPYEREMLLLEVDLTGLRASKRGPNSPPRATSPALPTARVGCW